MPPRRKLIAPKTTMIGNSYASPITIPQIPVPRKANMIIFSFNGGMYFMEVAAFLILLKIDKK